MVLGGCLPLVNLHSTKPRALHREPKHNLDSVATPNESRERDDVLLRKWLPPIAVTEASGLIFKVSVAIAGKGLAWIPLMILSGLRRVFRAPPYTVLRPDDHLPDTVAILAGYCEGLIDVFDLSGVCKQRSKPLGVRVE